MSKQVLRMKYHPAKQEVRFQRFQSGEEIFISDDSKLKDYGNKRGKFVLQYQGKPFFDDIAAEFDSEPTVQIDVVTTKKDYEDFEQMVKFYNADNPSVTIDSMLISELPNMEEAFHDVKKHGEHSLDILEANKTKFSELLTNTNNTEARETINLLSNVVHNEIENIMVYCLIVSIFMRPSINNQLELIRGEGSIPRPSGAVIGYGTRDQYLMRTTYPAALRRGMLIVY
jgi:hypothetical protein